MGLHNHATFALTLLEHQVECKIARELDKPVIARLGHDEDTLDMSAHTGATWTGMSIPGSREPTN